MNKINCHAKLSWDGAYTDFLPSFRLEGITFRNAGNDVQRYFLFFDRHLNDMLRINLTRKIVSSLLQHLQEIVFSTGGERNIIVGIPLARHN